MRLILESVLTKRLFVIVAIICLLLSGAYGAYKTARYQSVNSDTTVNTYSLIGGLGNDQVSVSEQHTNLIKIPFLAVQAALPFTIETFTIGNVFLTISTLFGWLLLLILIFGKKYTALFAISLASIFLGSLSLNLNLTYSTVRNVEFPLVLLFIVSCIRYLTLKSHPTRETTLLWVSTCLLVLCLASDNFLYYAIVLPWLGTLAWLLWKRAFPRNKLIYLIAIAVGAVFASSLIKLVVYKLGLINIDETNNTPLYIVEWGLLLPALWEALGQLLELFGAYIFGRPVEATILPYFINLLVLLFALVGFVLFLRHHFHANTRFSQQRVLTVFAVLSIITIFGAYIGGDQVVSVGASGAVESKGQERYLTFVPFLMIIGLYWVVKLTKPSKVLPSAIVLICFLGVGSSIIYRQSIYGQLYAAGQRKIDTFREIGAALKQNNVTVTVSGHWYGSATRFWTDSPLTTAIVRDCKDPQPYLTRKDWYKPTGGPVNSALIIDRDGQDSDRWPCGNKKLIDIYGEPHKTLELTAWNKTNVSIWIYEKDVRPVLTPYN